MIVLEGDVERARARVSLSLSGEQEQDSVRECAEEVQDGDCDELVCPDVHEMFCYYDHIYFGCVREKERERERNGKRKRKRESVCVCQRVTK